MRKALPAILFALVFAANASAQLRMALNNHLYDENANAKQEIADAIYRAQRENKRVLLVFGANWCYDCHVLDYRFHEDGIREVVDKNYHVVHVDIGQYDKNLDLPEKYGTTIKKGVPAISILSPTGKVLFGDTTGEFEKARSMDPRDLVAFLEKWKK